MTYCKRIFQIERIDFDKLFSLVILCKTACLFLVIASLKDWNIYSINIKIIYLYSDLNEKIYIEQSKVLGYLAKKRKSSDFTKYYIV